MAQVLDDPEFWLPAQFLTDDDLFMDQSKKAKDRAKLIKDGFGLEFDGAKSLFPFEFSSGFGSFGFSSDLNSPVESVVGSTETESDEEDYLAGLTRQMARSTIEGDFRRKENEFPAENPEGWVMSSSPESTLCEFGSVCGSKSGSRRGSPNCQSRVSSPPGTWDLLYAAAGEVERMRIIEEAYGGGFSNTGLLGPAARKPSPNIDVSVFYPPQQSLSNQKLQACHQFQNLKQQQLMKQQNASVWGGQKQKQQQRKFHVVQNKGRNSTSRPLGLSPSAWPPSQQQMGSGMRAIFLGNPTGKRECAGTGVFLPRRNCTPEPRKKPACSTALLPDRVVQALNMNLLNMNLDESGAKPQLHPRFNASLTAESGKKKKIATLI
ncbi:hypothetical protein PTKIN_Ptkin13bG0289300 [Pterospermum kingtungense]